MFLGEHGLEAIEVVHGDTLGTSLSALGPGGLAPLGGNVGLLESLLDGDRASTALDGDLQVGESQVLEVNDATDNTVAGTIDEGLKEKKNSNGSATRFEILPTGDGASEKYGK